MDCTRARRCDRVRTQVLANPDLPERFRERSPLNRDDPTTYYGGGEEGYVDYLILAQQRGEEPKPCFDTRWR